MSMWMQCQHLNKDVLGADNEEYGVCQMDKACEQQAFGIILMKYSIGV